MFFRNKAQILSLVSLLVTLSIPADTKADDWSFEGDTGNGCKIAATVNDSVSGHKVAYMGLIRLSNDELNNISNDFEYYILSSDTGFFVESIGSRFKVEAGVDAQLTSKSINLTMSYISNSEAGSNDFIYSLTNSESMDLIDALKNKEEMKLELTTASSTTIYGVIKAESFTKSYEKFNQCLTMLD